MIAGGKIEEEGDHALEFVGGVDLGKNAEHEGDVKVMQTVLVVC